MSELSQRISDAKRLHAEVSALLECRAWRAADALADLFGALSGRPPNRLRWDLLRSIEPLAGGQNLAPGETLALCETVADQLGALRTSRRSRLALVLDEVVFLPFRFLAGRGSSSRIRPRLDGVDAAVAALRARATESYRPPSDAPPDAPSPGDLPEPSLVIPEEHRAIARRDLRRLLAIGHQTSGESVRAIAFYLPQFHPIPENDAWWGKGFTEWRLVARAKPLFDGHYQPKLPGALGFYDLRLPETLQAQAELANQYGVVGFAFYYYWFNGRRLLERPLLQFLEQAEIQQQFCICWANENWTRKWDGGDGEVLIAQHYSREDDLAFIRDIEPALRDPRYLQVKGRRVLLVYRVDLLPDARRTAETWRRYCRDAGIGELFLAAVQSFEMRDPRPYGFDAAVEFPTHNYPCRPVNHLVQGISPGFRGRIHDYTELVRHAMEAPTPPYTRFRCVIPSWDNTPRNPVTGHAYVDSSPDLFMSWLSRMRDSTAAELPPEMQLLFINAWNEWGEGAVLEPDEKWGTSYLEATGKVLGGGLSHSSGSSQSKQSR